MTITIGIREKVNEAIGMTDTLKTPIVDYWVVHRAFPEDNAAAGLPEPDKLIGNYVTGIAIVDGAMHLTLGNKANQKLHGKILTLQPLFVEDSTLSPVSWNCGYSHPPPGMELAGDNRTTVDNKHLPIACRDIPYAGTPE